jgi:hypothetical protein
MTTSLPSPELAFSDTASQPDEQLVSIPKTSTAPQPSNTLKQSTASPAPGQQMAASESLPEKIEKNGIDARTKISNLLKGKEQEWAAVAERKGPLRLLDLPMDVLKEIVKEVNI